MFNSIRNVQLTYSWMPITIIERKSCIFLPDLCNMREQLEVVVHSSDLCTLVYWNINSWLCIQRRHFVFFVFLIAGERREIEGDKGRKNKKGERRKGIKGERRKEREERKKKREEKKEIFVIHIQIHWSILNVWYQSPSEVVQTDTNTYRVASSLKKRYKPDRIWW